MRTTIIVEESARPARRRTTPAATSASRRYMLRVPDVDTSFVRWWAAQNNPSASVRALIRAEITANGFTDTVNRPVVVAPRAQRSGATSFADLVAAMNAIQLAGDLGLVHA